MKKIYTLVIAIIFLTSTTYGMYGFLTGESTNGTSKTCYYNVGGSTKTLDISASQNCPVSHDF